MSGQSRTFAIRQMAEHGKRVRHESFGAGEFCEYDNDRWLFVREDGDDCTYDLFYSRGYEHGWELYDEGSMEDILASRKTQEEKDVLVRFEVDVIPIGKRVFYFSGGKSGTAAVVGFRVTNGSNGVSREYKIKYDSTGCDQWVGEDIVFLTREAIALSVLSNLPEEV